MPTFIDIRSEENHWNGNTGVQVCDQDGLDGCDMSLQMGETELVLTVSQAITLYDQLDGFVNGGPARELGAIRKRVIEAINELLQDNNIRLTKRSAEIITSDNFARLLQQYLHEKGLRYRLLGDEEYENHIARRARRAVAHNDPTNPLK